MTEASPCRPGASEAGACDPGRFVCLRHDDQEVALHQVDEEVRPIAGARVGLQVEEPHVGGVGHPRFLVLEVLDEPEHRVRP